MIACKLVGCTFCESFQHFYLGRYGFGWRLRAPPAPETEYAGAPYQAVAAKARAQLERLADSYSTPAREAELIAIFKEATRLEIEFWEMGWRAGQCGE